MQRFDTRLAGSAFEPFVVGVEEISGAPRDLTGDTAAWTFRKLGGAIAAVDAAPQTNAPDGTGDFEFQATPAQLSSPGEYLVTVVMMLSGMRAVANYGFTIDPAF